MSLVKFYNIQFLVVSTILIGVITYHLFNYTNWWNPIYAGVTMGLINILCISPNVIHRIKEDNKMRKALSNSSPPVRTQSQSDCPKEDLI